MLKDKPIKLDIFARRLTSLINNSSETTYSLANKLGLTPATISRYANGLMKPKVTTLKFMAQIFNVNDEWLIGYDVESTRCSDKTENSKETCKDDFSNNLIILRKSKHLSQAELADKLNLSRSIIGMWEAGQRKPSYETLKLLADYFDVSLDDLCGNVKTNPVGQRIKNLRLKNKLTQEELAIQLHTTKQTIYKYESGIISNIPPSRIEAIASVFQTTPAYLMGWTDDVHSAESENLQINNALLDAISGLSDEQVKQALDYIGYLKSKG